MAVLAMAGGDSISAGEAGGDPLADHVEQQRMVSEGGSDAEFDARMPGGRLGCKARNVLVPVLSRQQKIREDDDGFRSAFDAASKRRSDRGLGELHVGRLDNR